MKLWVRLALVVALVSATAVLSAGWAAADTAWRGAVRTNTQLLQREADVQATFVGRWLHDQLQAMVGWMQVPFRLGDAELQEAFQRSVFVAVPSVATVVLVDRDGVALVTPVWLTRPSDDPTLAGKPVGSAQRAEDLVRRLPLSAVLEELVLSSEQIRARRDELAEKGVDRALIDAVLSGDKRPLDGLDDRGAPLPGWEFVTWREKPPRMGQLGEAWLPVGALVPSVTAAVTRPSGDLVLGAEISLEALDEARGVSGPSHAVAVLDGKGAPVLGGGHPLVDAGSLRPLLGTRSSFSARAGLEDVIGAVSPVEGTDWTVIVVEPAAVLNQEANGMWRRMVAILAGSVVVAVAVGAVAARGVSGPVIRLREQALDLARGRYDVRAGDSRQDEIGDLSRAFDHLAERLEEGREEIGRQRKEIEAFNRELQQRVEERTRELEEAQRDLVKSGQIAALADIGAGLAHELNNPLAAILGVGQILQAREADPRRAALLGELVEEAQRCREVVAAITRSAAPDVAPEATAVLDLHGVIAEVVELVRGAYRQRGVELSWSGGEAARVRLDPRFGVRLFAQLLNTLRVGLEGGSRVEVAVRRAGSLAEVVISPDRAVLATDDRKAASLGLWIAHQSVRAMGGDLVEPVPPGLDYVVRLPIAGAP